MKELEREFEVYLITDKRQLIKGWVGQSGKIEKTTGEVNPMDNVMDISAELKPGVPYPPSTCTGILYEN